ncbi:MAG: glycoside hydrolase family 18 protein [Oscillospiraceae bacterium]
MSKIVVNYALDGATSSIRPEDLAKLTHLNIAFGQIQNDCSIRVDHLTLLSKISYFKSQNPNLKIILSIGSGAYESFSNGASTEENRKKVAQSCVEVILKYGLDGIDYDWEYPCCPSNGIASSPNDKENFTELCREIRAALDTITTKHCLFTIAAGGDAYYLDFTEMDKVQQYLDYVFVMTYDFRCGFHSLTGHHTNLYRSTGDIFRTSCKDALEMYNKAGVPMEKLVLGVAFYSRQWFDVPVANNGFLQYVKTNGGYGPSYTTLKADFIDKNGYVRYWDDESKAPYLFNGNNFISYDDKESVAAKCAYVKEINCAGAFAWDYSSDDTGDLLDAMYTNLK